MKRTKFLNIIATISLLVTVLALSGCASSAPEYSGASVGATAAPTSGDSSEDVIGTAANKAAAEVEAEAAAAAEAEAAEKAEAAAAEAAAAAATATAAESPAYAAPTPAAPAVSQQDDGCLTDVVIK